MMRTNENCFENNIQRCFERNNLCLFSEKLINLIDRATVQISLRLEPFRTKKDFCNSRLITFSLKLHCVRDDQSQCENGYFINTSELECLF